MRTLITNAFLVSDGQKRVGSLLIEDDLIAGIYGADASLPSADSTIDAHEALLLPGIIDDHVHFREPGLTHKADIAAESVAALAGGVTSVMDMPNVVPNTTTNALWLERQLLGAKECKVNYAFYLGATNGNLEEIKRVDVSHVPGIKLFMGSSTGNMLVDKEETLRNIFRHSPILIMAHCEDTCRINSRMRKAQERWGDDPAVECHSWVRDDVSCYQSSSFAAELARQEDARLHIAHITTAIELPLLGENVTGEVAVGHLLFTDADYKRLGSAIKVNPSVKTEADRQSLLTALNDGTITLIGSDHAPHLISEKEGGARKAASGMPMIQYSLVFMLELVEKGCLSIERLVRLMCHAPADLFGIPDRGYLREGFKADLVVVERKDWTLTRDDILSKCGWSPLLGQKFHYRVGQTFVNGCLAYDKGWINEQHRGKALLFRR